VIQKPNIPPGVFLRFFRWYCHAKLRDNIEGDLVELYNERVAEYGSRKADIQFAVDVMLLFRPGIIKPLRVQSNVNQYAMLKNYFKISWRNISKNKAFSAINVFGLAIGLAACLLILQFVLFELSFDHFQTKLDRTYRVTNDRFQNGKLIQHGTIMYPTIGPVMARDFPEVEDFVRIMPGGTMNVKIEDRNFRGDVSLFTDDHFLSVFDFEVIAGDRKKLLNLPYTAVLTQNTARKFFAFTGDDFSSLIGKTFFWGLDSHPYEVKGVLANIPANSHLQFDALVSYASLLTESKDADISWQWSDMRHYLVLKPGVDPKSLEAKFPAFSDRYFQGNKVSGSVEKFYLQPMKDAHLYSDYEYDIATTASGRAVWSMLIVGVFILVIAWINYINLTTSRAIERAREVGLRKVMGAFRSQLISQFVLESLLITAAATVLGILIITLLQPFFNQIVGTNLTWELLLSEVTANQIMIVIGGLVAGAVIAGFYPALTLSGYQPVTVLKGKFARSGTGNIFRKALVIFQFAASAALITCTLVVARQLDFMNTADLGFNMQNVLLVRSPELVAWDSTIINKVETFKNELKQVSGVANATTSWGVPGDRLGRSFDIRIEGQPAELHYTLSHTGVDHDFFRTMGIRLIAGREFLPTDHHIDFDKLNTIILNKKAVELFGFSTPAEALGHEVLWGNDGTRKWTIIGVVNDHHQEGLQKPMEAMLYRPAYSTYSSIMIKLEKTANTDEILPRIETLYGKFFTGNSFEYSFLEEKYNTQYNDEKRFSKVITIFTGLAIIVACLGLVGLSSYTALQRTKEIGVRKVLGASVANIVSILSIDFIKLVIIAALLSLPVAYYSMSEWLQTYTYRIGLTWALFMIPVLVVIIIAVLTICAQVLKAALAKPVDTLKYE
jgi:putative ABC transport system permease protein